LLGAAGEALGYDRHLKSNTTKRRTHSLFRQGGMHEVRRLGGYAAAMLLEMPIGTLRPLFC
jgi:hypothetical protein